MKVKPKILLYGAFDRYNYGDNFMPILFQDYFLKNFKEIEDEYEFEFVSISSSNLCKYGAKKSKTINDFLNVPKGSILVVIGGDTMQADIATLYMHKIENKINYFLLKCLKKIIGHNFNYFASFFYTNPWLYPYVPDKKSFKDEIKLILNTVSGFPEYTEIPKIKKMDYIAVRDLNSFDFIKDFNKNVKLIPDSVLLLSRIYDFDLLKSKVDVEKFNFLNSIEKYIVIQMSPGNASCSAEELCNILMNIKENKEIEPILLPIGYASGHDDFDFLKKVQDYSKGKLHLYYDLTIWEIAYVISRSSGYYGTSLHGAITAMAYAIPHFCINKNVRKLVSFLDTWSIDPFSKPIAPNEIGNYILIDYEDIQLREKIGVSQDCIEDHYRYIASEFLFK